MITAQIIGAEAVIAKLGAVPDRVVTLVRAAVEGQAIALTRYVKESKLSGQVLRNRSGLLRASISYALMIADQGLTAQVGTNVAYAAIHEYGGQTRAHVIEAKKAKALAFQMGGETIIRKLVHHPGSKMPERSFLRSSLRESRDRIIAAIERAVAQGIKG
jgi:phage gpG-like protein